MGEHTKLSRSLSASLTPARIAVVGLGLIAVLMAIFWPWQGQQAAVTPPSGPTTVATPVPVNGALVANDAIYTAAVTQLDSLLRARANAVARVSRSSLVAESGGSTATASIRLLAQNVTLLQPIEWTYGTPIFNGPLTTKARAITPRAVVVDVDLTTQLRYDAHPAVVPEHVTFVPSATGRAWMVATEVADGPGVPIWQAGALTVVWGHRSLVVGVGTSANLHEIATRSDGAVTSVTSVWGKEWEQGVVVVVPNSTATLSKLLGGSTRKEFAALTTASVPGLGVADRVWMVPGDWGKLDAKGRTVILRHEFTHVATQAAASTNEAPLWLAEGFADYVGYRGLGISNQIVAQELRAQARAGHAPTSLPTNTDFQQQGGDQLSSDYEQGWLACVTMASTYGQSTLVNFYRVAAKQGTDAAFAQVLHMTPSAFTTVWQSQVHVLAA
jgi:hypothetical protein